LTLVIVLNLSTVSYEHVYLPKADTRRRENYDKTHSEKKHNKTLMMTQNANYLHTDITLLTAVAVCKAMKTVLLHLSSESLNK